MYFDINKIRSNNIYYIFMSEIASSDEIEQRYIINPHRWLYLPRIYLEYHQAEIWSGKAWKVIDKFYTRTADIFSIVHNDALSTIRWFLSTISVEQEIKLRIRRIFDPANWQTRAEFTVKEKTDNPKFKIYREHNIAIDPYLATALIEHITPKHRVTDAISESGVRKFRYNIAWPDGMLWDVDALQWLNAWIYIGEIEVPSIETQIILPTWAVKKANGDPNFKFLGTKDLQKTPWTMLSEEQRNKYIEALNPTIPPSVF